MDWIALGSVACVMALACAGCGEHPTPASDPANSGGAGGAAGSGGSAGRELPPPGASLAFSIELPEVTLEPGDEVSPCYIFPLDLPADHVFINAARVITSEGMHHGNVTTRKATGTGIRECGPDEGGIAGGEATDVLSGGAVLFGSSTQLVGEEWHAFPQGMAYRVKQGYEIVARMHYLNVSPKVVKVAPSYEWYAIECSQLTEELAPFAWAFGGFHIPPRTEHTVSSECWLTQQMKVIDAMPHMHALGTRFFASFVGGARDGEYWLDDQGFDEASDIYQYTPAVDIGQGDGVTFGCTWNNTFDKEIVEGIGDNEMCILFGYGYPATQTYSIYATENSCLPVLPPPPDAP
ncbi:MAG: hypothetical protein AB7K71_10125 [Polyangiaceae bacterium]